MKCGEISIIPRPFESELGQELISWLVFVVRFGPMFPRESFFSLHALRWLIRLSLVTILFVCGGVAHALPSACTAMWGLQGNPSNLAYWTGSSWSAVAPVTGATTAGNAMGGWGGNGSLYWVTRVNTTGSTPTNVVRADFDNANGTITFTTITGNLQTLTTPFPTYTATGAVLTTWTPTFISLVGATFNRDLVNKRMFLYATGSTGAGAPVDLTNGSTSTTIAAIGLLDPESPTAVSWQIVRDTTGGATNKYPALNTSGDIFADQIDGSIWIVTNTNPNKIYKLDLQFSGLSLTSANVIATASIPSLITSAAAITVDPLSGNVFLSQGTTNGSASATFVFDNHTLASVGATQKAPGGGVGDSGNCVEQPDAPTVTKVITPGFVAATPGTATLTLTILNPNKVPIFLSQSLTDTFPTAPAQMRVFATPVTAACFSDGVAAVRPAATTVTAPVAGDTRFVINSGSVIPGGTTSGGSCSFSVLVSASAAVSAYTNTIVAGSLSTTAGSNTVAASATLTVGTDFSVTKQVRVGTSGTLTDTVAIGGPATLQYVLNIVNSLSGGTGTATFTDTLPTQISPLLTVTAVATGGGACSTATSVVGSQNRITGTFAGAPAGATCTVTITAMTLRSQAGVFPNTVTLATGADTADVLSTNNNATATATISATSLTITKTNGISTVTYGGTTAYTITVANVGSQNAPNALLKDPAATGLSCTNVVCSSGGGGAVCPAAGSVTISNLQGTGIALTPTFSAGHTLNFVVTCNVTATGS